MTDGFTCTDKDTLIAYLYGECDTAERRLVESHLATCRACAEEIDGLGAARAALTGWETPEFKAGVRVATVAGMTGTPDAALPEGSAHEGRRAQVLRPARWWRTPLPALARLAAGILLFAGGAALANLEVRYDQNGLVVRTGWQRAPDPAPAAPAVDASAGSPWRTDLASLERRLREDFEARSVSAAPAGVAQVPALDERALMTRVRTIVDERASLSEQRMMNELAYRVTQVNQDFAAQRLADQQRVLAGLGQFQGMTTAEVAQQRQILNRLLMTVSEKK